jgi:hypothetical protein
MPHKLAILVALTAIALALASGAPFAGGTPAQEAITVVSEEPRNEFPTGVTFAISFRAPAAADDVRLRYELAPDGTGATAAANCSDGATTNCTFTLTSGRGIFVIPGAEITYHWEIEDADGNSVSTPERLYVHEDTRFQFETISEANVTVHYQASTGPQAQAVLAAALETLERIGALQQTQVAFPVKVFLYRSAAEMQPAIASSSGGGVRVLGEVAYSDTAMVSADTETLDIARHEIAHIVTREAVKGPFNIPLWLSEGISVFAQTGPIAGEGDALDSAIATDRVLSLAELQSSASRGLASSVSLFYGQSGAIVAYLVDQYGEEKFAELLRTFREGSTIDNAFETVYGFDQFGLENEWREFVGLDARDAPVTSTPPPADGAATDGDGASDDDPSTASGGDSDETPFVVIGLIAVMAVAVIAASYGVYAVARRRL